MARQRKLKDYGAWWETWPLKDDDGAWLKRPPRGGYSETGFRGKVKTHSNFNDIDRNNRFDKTIKKPINSKPFLSKKSNWRLIFRLFGFTTAIIFATLSVGDGTLRFIESYKTTIHNENYAFNNGDITFYNYDWKFKIKQLDNFAPMFTINDDYDNEMLSPSFYYQSFKNLVERGDIIYDHAWTLSSSGLDSDFSKKIFYYRFKFRGTNNPYPVRGLFIYEDGNVVIGDDKLYQKWTNQYEQRTWFEDTAFSKYVLGSTLVVLNLPVNFTYNLLCAFDLLLRW